jgi:hypothetical protein
LAQSIAYTGTAPLRTGPLLFPRVLTHPVTLPFRCRASYPLKRGRDARRFGVDLGINRGDIYIYIYICASVEAQDLRGAFSPYLSIGGFCIPSSVTLNFLSARGVQTGCCPFELRGLTGIWFTNWRGPSCLKLDRAAARRRTRHAAYIQCSLHYGAPRCPHFLRHAFGILMFHCHVHKLTGRPWPDTRTQQEREAQHSAPPARLRVCPTYPLCHDVTFCFACCGSARCGPVPII